MMSNSIKQLSKDFLNLVNNHSSICITCHVNPDGDSVGSVLALGLSLIEKGYSNITMYIPDDIPDNLKFLPKINLIKNSISNMEFDMVIALDCGDKKRISIDNKTLESVDCLINIDHHITNTEFGDFNFVNPSASSTAEIIYQILEYIDVEINKDIATALYTAISTDTGSFKYDNCTSYTHKIIAKLLSIGIDVNLINVNLYQSRSIEKTRLLINSLNSLELLYNGKLAIAEVTQFMIKNCNANIEDADYIIDFIRDIKGVEVACLLKEIDNNEIKISLRSKTNFDVSLVAKNFQGGGHTKAAGCTINSTLEKSKKLILEEIHRLLRG